jgi:hypothetical protein
MSLWPAPSATSSWSLKLWDGSGYIEVNGQRVDIVPDMCIRVGPNARRKIYSGPQGLRIIALGGIPGRAYEATPFGELSA